MISKRLSILMGLLLCQLFLFPIYEARSQSASSDDPARVISLSATGTDRANAVAFSPDGSSLAVASSAGVSLFEPQTLSLQATFPTNAWVRTLAVSSDGTSLAAGLSDEKALLMSFPGLQPIHELAAPGGWVRSIAFTPDGRFTVIAAGDAVHIRHSETGASVLTIGHLYGVRAIAVSPDGSTLAVGLQDNSIQLRSLSKGDLRKTFLGHEGWVRCLAFSPDGSRLASGAFDATARVWDVASGDLLYTLSDHESSVLGIAFSPDGSTLATGSVDQTVRLWSAQDGTPSRTLVGHSGFVYSVAFSPDGRVVASGANDNTVRLWDLTSPEQAMPEIPETPGDCRACHHPLNSTSPVAVVDVRCDACHPNGLGVNWCPFFSPSTSETKMEIVGASHERLGLPAPGRELAVMIFAPANGEVLYSHSDYAAPFQVTGKVMSSALAFDSVDVHLEVWAGGQMLSSLSKPLQPNGQFAFNLAVNPHGRMLRINDPAAPFNCAYCHDDFYVEARVPAGDIRLRVVATSSNGDQAADERWIITDVNKTLSLPVRIVDGSSGEPVEGLTVHAFARLYEWRGRTSTAVSLGRGVANLSLEMLSQAPTVYEVKIPDQVVDGIFYSAEHTSILTIDPQQAGLAPIELKARARKGQIDGVFHSDTDTAIAVWAVQLPAGPARQTQVDVNGHFSFADIPVAEYVVSADPQMLFEQDLAAAQTNIDLRQSPQGSVELISKSATELFAGNVTGTEGEWVPFTWLVATGKSIVSGDLYSGIWFTHEDLDQTASALITAPGYYSQAVRLSDHGIALTLKRRPDAQSIIWGSGEITLPAETKAEASPGKIDFDSGWVWGLNREDQRFSIHTDEGDIRLSRGQFALERRAGGMAWLYLFSGQAEFQPARDMQPIPLASGQMLALSQTGEFSPLLYEPAALSSLRSDASAPVSPLWEPTPSERFQAISLQTGVILAQFVTFITYFVVVISLVVIPWWTVRWISNHRIPRRRE